MAGGFQKELIFIITDMRVCMVKKYRKGTKDCSDSGAPVVLANGNLVPTVLHKHRTATISKEKGKIGNKFSN